MASAPTWTTPRRAQGHRLLCQAPAMVLCLSALLLILCPLPATAGPESIKRRTTDNFTFVYRERYWSTVRNTVAIAEQARTELIEQLGADEETPRVEVRFARNVEEMRELCPHQPPGYADAVAFWRENLIVISLTSSHHRPVSIATVFRHELSHVGLRWVVGDAQIPRWFNEGLAVYNSNELPLDRMQALWKVAPSGGVIPLAQLDRSFPEREYQVNLAYAQSADFVRYLVHHRGQWRIPELLQRVSGGEHFYDAMRATWGRTVANLESSWRTDLRNRYTLIPSVTAGAVLWALVGIFAVVAYILKRREVRRRIAAMGDGPIPGEVSESAGQVLH